MHEVITPPLPALPGGAAGDRRVDARGRRGDATARRRRSTRRPAGRASSPTRRTSSSSTAARRRSPRPQRALDELGIDDVAVCGLAKRLEEVWLPGDDDPVILPRTSEGLYLLQRVRDEAHRFAITYHRQQAVEGDDGRARWTTCPGSGEPRASREAGSLKQAAGAR